MALAFEPISGMDIEDIPPLCGYCVKMWHNPNHVTFGSSEPMAACMLTGEHYQSAHRCHIDCPGMENELRI